MKSLADYSAPNRELKKDHILLDIQVIPECQTEGHTPIHLCITNKKATSTSVSQSQMYIIIYS